MKRILLLVFLLAVSLSASGLEIKAPQTAPANTNIAVTVSLNSSDSFTETKVFVDGESVLMVKSSGEVFPYTRKAIAPFIADLDPKSNSGLTLYFSYFGLEEGTHLIKVKSFNEGSLTEEKEVQVEAVSGKEEPQRLEEVYDELGTNILDLQIKLKKLVKEITAFKESTQGSLSEKEGKLSDYFNLIQELKNQVSSLKDSLTEAAFKKEEEPKTEEALLEKKEGSDKKTIPVPVTGFASVGKTSSLIIALLWGIAMLFFALNKMKKTGFLRGKVVFEEALEESSGDGDDGLKKWAYNEAMGNNKTEEKKLHFKDLLKKD